MRNRAWIIFALLLAFSAGSCTYGLYLEGKIAFRAFHGVAEALP
jgi:hypothetical protein